ncbi:MAG: 30S ribosomal protein S21 [Verrucomicrobiota bacterium]
MPQVEVKKGESVDRALKRLKSKLESEGVLEEVRRLRAFETPIQRYRRKQRTAAKKTRLKFRANLNVFRRENTRKALAEAEAANAEASAPGTADAAGE